jgi:mxaK protein
VALNLRWAASRRSLRALLAALALLALAAAFDALQWWRLERWNAQIAALGSAASTAAGAAPAASAASVALPWDDAAATAEPALRFAQAHALASLGHSDAAINQYGRVPADAAVGRAARFNSANLLLRQGIALQAGAQPGQALAFVELAKEGYRELLRQDPAHWPARYNLERAQRLVADPEEGDDSPAAAPLAAERAATTMRGYSAGLP